MKKSSIRSKIIKRFDQQKHTIAYQDIGSLIKEKRKELKLTQELISNGICSISYLSKIENNQISPNEYFVREIMEKLQVDESLYQKTIDDQEYLEGMIKAIYYDDKDKSYDLYNEISEYSHNIVLNICKLGYIAHHYLWDDSQYVMMLEHLIKNMSDYELKAYLLFAMMYNITNSLYSNALDLFMTYKEVSESHKKLDALASEYGYRIMQELDIHSGSMLEYLNALKLYKEAHNFNRISKLRLTYVSNMIQTHHVIAKNELKSIEKEQLNSSETEFYHLLLARINFIEKSFNEATLSLSYIKEDSAFYYEKMILLYEICVTEKDEGMIKEITSIIEKLPHDKAKIKSKIYYHYLLQKTEEDQKEYLRDIAIPFSIKVGDMKSLYMYTDIIMQLCIEKSRYKEATLHYKKYKKEVVKVQKIIS